MRARLWLFIAVICHATAFSATCQSRLKDVSTVRGVRPNFVAGYGLVIGLSGTGDNPRNSPFTQQAAQSLMDRMGINVRGAPLRGKNIAAVMVTAELPPFARRGDRIDAAVASLGDATSLLGGQLLTTALSGADDVTYAVAQGPLVVSALTAAGKAEAVTRGTATSAKLPNGAILERDAPGKLDDADELSLQLRNPDFQTAIRAVDAINGYAQGRFRKNVAFERDLRTIDLKRPPNISVARFLAEIGELPLRSETPARVVVDERSGTIVIGNDVRIAPVAISHGGITVKITEADEASQPNSRSNGQTAIIPRSSVTVSEAGGNVAPLQGTSLQSIVSGLNRMGLKPNGIIAVLQSIHAAGAMNAEFVVQ